MELDQPLTVEVPASSANLGPGFDVLAVAVDLRLRVWTTPPGDVRVRAEGEGAEELTAGDDNLIWRAFVAWHERVGADIPDVSLSTRSTIPLERGLGSSAAAAVAGAALGRGSAGAGGRDADVVEVATELEGHADNAAAAALGGLVVVADGRSHRLIPSERLRPVVCVPDDRLATSEARALLPANVPLATAATTAARAALVVAGLAGAAALTADAMVDDLHEPPRFAAMPATGALVAQLRDRGVAACLSGAGPSVLAVVPVDRPDLLDAVRATAGDGWQVREQRWDLGGAALSPPRAVIGR